MEQLPATSPGAQVRKHVSRYDSPVRRSFPPSPAHAWPLSFACSIELLERTQHTIHSNSNSCLCGDHPEQAERWTKAPHRACATARRSPKEWLVALQLFDSSSARRVKRAAAIVAAAAAPMAAAMAVVGAAPPAVAAAPAESPAAAAVADALPAIARFQ